MILAEQLPQIVEPVFGERFWPDTTPDGMPRSEMDDPFCIWQKVGGTTRQFVDDSTDEWWHSRVQFYVWGDRRLAVDQAMYAFYRLMMASNSETFIVIPSGMPVDDRNEVLALRGSRVEFSIWWQDT